MSKIPTFESLKAKPIGNEPVFYKSAQVPPPGAPEGMPPGQGMGGVTTGTPDEMQAPESADETQFENDFSNLAFQFVQDRAPALMPYMLGFEVVDRTDDGSKAVGIYGYKIDDDFYYIPVFFLNNQIRGVDMILNKRTNNFMPLTEDWINYIVDRHNVTLGKDVGEEATATLEQPDLNFLREPQSQGAPKTASAKEPQEMWSLKTAWEVMKDRAVKMAETDPLLKDMFNGVLRAVKGVPMKKSAESRYIKGFMKTVGGPEAQVSLLKTLRNVKFANAALTFYDGFGAFDQDDVKDAYIHRSIMAKKAAALPKVKIVSAEEIEVKDETSLSEDDARRVMTRGFTIQDARPPETTSDMVDDTLTVDFEKRFSTPTEVGKYSFVMADGKLRDGFLLSLTHTSGSDKDSAAVYFPEDKVLAKAPARSLVTDSGTAAKSKGSSFKELFISAMSKEDCVPSSTGNSNGYMFIGPDGQALGPFKVNAVFKDGDDVSYRVSDSNWELVVSTSGDRKVVDFGNWDISDRFHDQDGYRNDKKYNCECECCCCDSKIRFCDGISRPSVTSKGIVLPDSWKVVEVANVKPSTPYDPDKSEEARENDRKEDERKRLEYDEKYTFGSMSCILSTLSDQGIARVKIASVGPDEFHLQVAGFNQTPRMTYKQAAVALVTRFGAKPASAFRSLDKAAEEGSAAFLVSGRQEKKAQVGVSMQSPEPQAPSVDPYTGIPVYSDPYMDSQQGQFTGVPSLPPEGGLTQGIADGSEIQRATEGPEDGMMPIDQQAQDLADQAAQAGQKHVFDQAAIGGLSKVYDTSAVVDSYIPTFMDSLDRIGRILFLFYWKHEDFNARYGSDDVVEMEDRLRSVFKQLGDLTLQLKEKAVRED